MKRQSTFKQQDVTRALRATHAAGVAVSRIEIDRAGKIVIVTGVPDEVDLIDKDFEEFDRRHGRC